MSEVWAWINQLRLAEASCPWTGPRPFLPEIDGAVGRPFHGRENDLTVFTNVLDVKQVVVLHGESGVGKSSFLYMGLSEVLPKFSFTPVFCSSWPKLGSMLGQADRSQTSPFDQDFNDYMAAAIVQNLHEQRQPVNDAWKTAMHTKGVADTLLKLPGTPVLVLDQFEEFLRQATPAQTTRMAEWIEYVDRRTDLKLVLSLRSEYLYKIPQITQRLRPFSFDTIDLLPITDPDSIRKIICGRPTATGSAIEPDVVERIFDDWDSQRKVSETSALLGLQALLYALYWIANGEAGAKAVSMEDYRSLLNRVPTRINPSESEAIFDQGFLETLQAKLKLGEDTATMLSRDSGAIVAWPALRDQLRGLFSEMFEDDYKRTIKLSRLLYTALGHELSPLNCGLLSYGALTERGQELCNALWSRTRGALVTMENSTEDDILSLSRSEVLQRAFSGDNPESVKSDTAETGTFSLDCTPWVNDPYNVTAGALAGMRPTEVAVELIRSFMFLITWLDTAHICRVTKDPSFMDAQIHVVHDGLGKALRTWVSPDRESDSDKKLRSQSVSETSLNALVAKEFLWGDFAPGRGSQVKYVINAAWRLCSIIETTFTDVVFVNCDLSATCFSKCTFRGVTFVNCLLGGAVFEKCTFRGLPDRLLVSESLPEQLVMVMKRSDPNQPAFLPSFTLPSIPTDDPSHDCNQATLQRFQTHRLGTPGNANSQPISIFSRMSGVPAYFVEGDAPILSTSVPRMRQGLTIMGGWVSSLMVRGGTFAEYNGSPGGILVAYVSGSAMDFVDIDQLNLSILGSALRNMSFSRPLGTIVDERRSVTIDVQDTLLINTWFSNHIKGNFSSDGSCIYGLSSMSPGLDLTIPPCDFADAATPDPVEMERAISRLQRLLTDAATRWPLQSVPLKTDYGTTEERLHLSQESKGTNDY